MRRSRLPTGGLNLFQQVRAKRTEALEQGLSLMDLSIGEPKGAALTTARQAAAEAILSDDEAMHAYQYNASPGVAQFAERFVRGHLSDDLTDDSLSYLPIPGIKPILGLLPLACGCANESVTVATMTRPGYPTPADWCAYHPHVTHKALSLSPDNAFRFAPSDIGHDVDLIMMNYPHNPSGQIASTDWLHSICEFCSANDIRLFNDAAYISLSHSEDSTALSEVADHYPALSWAEAFTAAKLIGNGTGWHVGAMVGSADFITNIAEVKGKTDTGHVAPMAAGAIACLENDQASIAALRAMYARRLDSLMNLLSTEGMRPAIEPKAGFYTLWKTPDRAFGEAVHSPAEFNFRMITEVGVVGVHFGEFIRYAVCDDVEAIAESLTTAFRAASVQYDD
ncbi:MAG: aminotransferase class I/II-fold pyridoxal phosphate-dependent enzyme [Pseudomonadota bacterium]